MTPSPPQDPQSIGAAPPPVMTSDQILQHVDSVYKSLPEPVQAALDHAHSLTGGQPGSGLAQATAPPPVDAGSASLHFPSVGMVAGGPDQAKELLAQNGRPSSASPSEPTIPLMAGPSRSIQPDAPLGASDAAPPPVDTGTSSKIAPAPSPARMEGTRLNAPPINPGTNASAHTNADTGRPGIGQIHNPWLRGLATAGDVIASGVFPRFGQFIPGTSAHHQLLVNQNENAQGEENANAKSDAEVAREAAETKLAETQVPHVQAETAALGNPKDEFALFHQQNPNGTVTDFVKQQEAGKDPTAPYQIWHKEPGNAGKGYMDFLKDEVATKPPTNELELYVKTHPDEANPLAGYEHEKQNITSKPLTKATADAMNADYNTLATQYKGIPQNQFQEGMTSAEATQIKAAMLGAIAGTQKGQTITINQGKADAAKANIPGAVENVNPKFVQHAVTGYEKVSNEYENAKAANDDIQTALDEAKKGNKLAYAYEPVLGVLTINTAAGVKRINMPEVTSYAGAGSLGDKITGYFGKQTSGASIPPDILKDMGEFHQSLANNAIKKYNSKIDIINKTYGSTYPHEGEESGAPQSGNSGAKIKVYDEASGGFK